MDSATAAMPTGTLTKKVHSHDRYSVRMPPSSRPTAAPPTAMAAQTASAFARSAPSRKVVVTIERAAGETIAAPEALEGAGGDEATRTRWPARSAATRS